MNRYSTLLLVLLVMACDERIPEPESISIEGMTNAVRVGDVLIGGQPSEVALKQLAEEGYKTVLSTRGQSENSWDEKAVVESLGMRFVSIAMEKPVEEITDEQVAHFAEIMDNADRPVFLHCGSGNRISGLWAVWLVEHKNISPQKALSLAEKTGMKGVRNVVEQRLRSEKAIE